MPDFVGAFLDFAGARRADDDGEVTLATAKPTAMMRRRTTGAQVETWAPPGEDVG